MYYIWKKFRINRVNGLEIVRGERNFTQTHGQPHIHTHTHTHTHTQREREREREKREKREKRERERHRRLFCLLFSAKKQKQD